MEHIEAMKSKAAERYLLGEMTDAEAESFEEHYFDCSVCANDVRDEAKVLEWGREIAREDRTGGKVVPIGRRWKDWLPLAAVAILVIGVGLPTLMMRSDRGPSSEAGKILSLQVGVNRGPSEPVRLASDQSLVLVVDFTTDDAAAYSRYELTVRDARGNVRRRLLNREEIEQGQATEVLSGSPAGMHELTIEGVRKEGNRTEIGRQSFTVQY